MLTPAVTLCQLWDKAMGIVTASAASVNLVVLGWAVADSVCSEDCGLLDPSGDTWGGSGSVGAVASSGIGALARTVALGEAAPGLATSV